MDVSSYHDCVVSKVTYGPITAQLNSVEGDYLGSVQIGFTKEVKEGLFSRTPPYNCKVKARGWTSKGKLRIPLIISIE